MKYKLNEEKCSEKRNIHRERERERERAEFEVFVI